MKLIKIKGVYDGEGRILLNTEKAILWNEITNENPPELPFGIAVEISISFEEEEFLLGTGGIVWATYDQRQAEVIKNALFAMQINSDVKQIAFVEKEMFVMKIANNEDVNEAIDFIWRNNSGLRLKPDWRYEEGKTNNSFDQWLSGQ